MTAVISSQRRRRTASLWSIIAMVAALASPLLGAAPASAAPGDITTLAGGGVGDNGPATTSVLDRPGGIGVDAAGNLFIADLANRIRRVDATTGIITTIAGNGTYGFSGDGGPATKAQLAQPAGVVVDASGNVLFSDNENGRIRRVDAKTGIITTVVGGGTADGAGDHGPATAVQLYGPQGLAVDSQGNLYIADSSDQTIRKVTPGADGVITGASDEIITIVAGQFSVQGFGGDGGPAIAATLNSPIDVAVDGAGNLLIADLQNNRVRKVNTAGIITTVAGTGDAGFSGDGGPAIAAMLNNPAGVAFDGSGGFFIGDFRNLRVRHVDASGTITTVAGSGAYGDGGDGGITTAAQLTEVGQVRTGPGGILYLTIPVTNRIRKVVPGADGVVNGGSDEIITKVAGGSIGDGLPGPSARLEGPFGVAAGSGNVFVSEDSGQRVRKIDSSGVISTYAGGGSPADGIGDRLPATQAALNNPKGLALDSGGRLYIADCGNQRVRRVNAAGIITTVAGGGGDYFGENVPATSAYLTCPTGVFVVGAGSTIPAGTLLIADCAPAPFSPPSGGRVRKVDPSGLITTVAGTGFGGFSGDGGPAPAATLACPSGVTADAAGNIYIADRENNRVRRVDTSGIITTYAGDGATGFGSDGVPATATHVTAPAGLSVGPDGTLYIGESGYHRVRKVNPAGIISTVAGIGIPGFSGDGGPATKAQLNVPTGVTVDHGNLYIADHDNNRVRRVELGKAALPPPGCGQIIKKNTTLAADIGPCAHDGIVIGADNITVDLNGHSVFGTDASGDGVGIRLDKRTGVTIKGNTTGGTTKRGSVSSFDAGVAIIGGSANTVTNLSVHDNIGPVDSSTPFGDGIAMFFSSNNRIIGNNIVHNGIYDGIAVLGQGSNGNLIQNNKVRDTIDGGIANSSGGLGITLTPIIDAGLPRDVLISNNTVLHNVIERSASAGVSSVGNIDGAIRDNTVVNNGLDPRQVGNGIGVRPVVNNGVLSHMLIQGNQVHGNALNGMVVVTQENRILNNDASNNNVAPSPFFGRGFDLHDVSTGGVDCDSNIWSGNLWGSGGFDPPCTTAGGHAVPGTPPIPMGAVTQPASPDSSVSGTQIPSSTDLRRGHPPKPE